jgi:hypothetical protein
MVMVKSCLRELTPFSRITTAPPPSTVSIHGNEKLYDGLKKTMVTR